MKIYKDFLKLLKRHGLEPEQKPKQRSLLQTSKEESKQQEQELKITIAKKN